MSDNPREFLSTLLEKGTYLDRGRTFVVATRTGGADPTTG
jgi:hypothetical protein